jgi:hypothetical protein|tara:strand:+ start:56 stop:226 length:171 start_codon:yes stop_codon:yes gene_type:complete
MNEGTKQILDGASVTIAVSSLASWLPPAAAFFTIIWSLIRIYETKTVQRLLARIRK